MHFVSRLHGCSDTYYLNLKAPKRVLGLGLLGEGFGFGGV